MRPLPAQTLHTPPAGERVHREGVPLLPMKGRTYAKTQLRGTSRDQPVPGHRRVL